MEKGYLSEDEVKQNFRENNKEILGINDEEKLKKEIEVRNTLIREKDAQMKKFKRLTGVYVVLSALTIASLTSYSSIVKKQFELYKNRKSTVYDNDEKKITIDNAFYEIIGAYSDYALNEYEKTLTYDDVTKEETMNALKDSYYYPLREAIDDYRSCDSQDKDYYKQELINKSKSFDAKMSDFRSDLGFSKTIFSRAKYIDGEICVPSPYIIENSELSYNQVLDPDDNKTIYIPLSSLSEDEINVLGK